MLGSSATDIQDRIAVTSRNIDRFRFLGGSLLTHRASRKA
jgi:hypothetical protein